MKTAVIIPAHNMERLIHKAIGSVKAQTVPPDEIIVASDGSTDNTVKIARELGVTVLDLPKGNGNVARNAGYRASSAELLFFLDSDDWYFPEKIERHIKQQTLGDYSVVIDPCTAISEEGFILRLCGPALNGPIEYKKFLSRTYWYGGSAMSVRRDKLDAIGGWREELPSQQDVDVWLRLAHENGPGFVMADSLTFYLQSTGSLSRTPKTVEKNLGILLSGLPFLSHNEKRQLWSHVIFTAADNLPISKAWPYLRTATDRILDPRFLKSVIRSLRKGLS